MSQPIQNGDLLSLEEAAAVLGYTVKGLRKIVDRSRSRAHGARTRGPTIKFFQTSRGAPVKFRPEWVEDFIDKHTINPERGAPKSNGTKKKKKVRMESTCGFDRDLLNI